MDNVTDLNHNQQNDDDSSDWSSDWDIDTSHLDPSYQWNPLDLVNTALLNVNEAETHAVDEAEVSEIEYDEREEMISAWLEAERIRQQEEIYETHIRELISELNGYGYYICKHRSCRDKEADEQNNNVEQDLDYLQSEVDQDSDYLQSEVDGIERRQNKVVDDESCDCFSDDDLSERRNIDYVPCDDLMKKSIYDFHEESDYSPCADNSVVLKSNQANSIYDSHKESDYLPYVDNTVVSKLNQENNMYALQEESDYLPYVDNNVVSKLNEEKSVYDDNKGDDMAPETIIDMIMSDEEKMAEICDTLGICEGVNIGVSLYGYLDHLDVYIEVMDLMKYKNVALRDEYINSLTCNKLRDIKVKIRSEGKTGRKKEMIAGIIKKLNEFAGKNVNCNKKRRRQQEESEQEDLPMKKKRRKRILY